MHTPGPWKVTGRKAQEWDIDAGPEPRLMYSSWDRLATVYGSDDNPIAGSEVGRANARLIAAAPDLLEALKEVVSVSDSYIAMNKINEEAACITKARAAIAKAEGK